MKLKVSKGELIISNGLEMADNYLPGGWAHPPPLFRVNMYIVLAFDTNYIVSFSLRYELTIWEGDCINHALIFSKRYAYFAHDMDTFSAFDTFYESIVLDTRPWGGQNPMEVYTSLWYKVFMRAFQWGIKWKLVD